MKTNQWAARLMCAVIGMMIGAAITAHLAANEVQARNAQVSASLDEAKKQADTTQDLAQRVIDAYRGRAEKCEAKFTVGTIVYQQQPLVSVPMLSGLAALDVNAPGGPKPSLYIPAQVVIYTNRPDVRYAWIDGRTGAAKDGVHVALPPSSVK